MVKPVFRRKSIGTKVSEEEYARLEALAGGRALGEWVREVLLRELDGGQASGFNGITYSLGYNNRLSPSSISAISSNGTALNLSYSYFANGNAQLITNNKDNGRTTTYGYDSLNRINSAATQATSGGDCWGQAVPPWSGDPNSYGYDRYGNLSKIDVTQCSAPSLSVTINGNNQMSGLSYNGAGDVTSDGSYNYTWDAENRLSSVAGVAYTYDGDGQRVKRGSSKLYWRDASGSVLAETDTSGNTLNEYIFFGGRIARRDSSGNVYYYFANALGSPTVTNATGGLCYDADFYPFGSQRIFTNTCAQSYQFASLEQDSETGDYHTWFRQYSPTEVRWLSPDTLGGDVDDPQSFNRYSYAENNPCNLTDPLGLSTCALNIKLQNKAGSLVDLGSVEAEINQILAVSDQNQPNSVTANFVTSGKSDYTVNIVNGNPKGAEGWAGLDFLAFWFPNPSVNAASIADSGWGSQENQEIGKTVVHELTHRAVGIGGWSEYPFNGGPNDQVYMLQEESYRSQFGNRYAVFGTPTGVILSPDELKAFYKKCIKKHPGGGGGGGGAALPNNTGTETMWSCSSHLYWGGELGPGTSTTCTGMWSFGYGFRGFIL